MLKKKNLNKIIVICSPATIMTDANIADRVYIEPLTVDFLAAIIEKERPDGLLATPGGQAGFRAQLQ